MIRKQVLILLTVVMTANVDGMAQDTLSLREALGTALEKNFGIIVSNIQKRIADNNVAPGNAGMLPKVDATAGADMSFQNTDLEFDGAIPPVDENWAQSTTINVSIGLTYTLFDGLGMFRSYSKLKEMANLGDAEARMTVEQTIEMVTNAYFEVARLQSNLGIVEEAVGISIERMERAKARYEFGTGSQLDVLNAKVDLTSDSSALIQTELALGIARRNLSFLLGGLESAEFEVSTMVSFNEEIDYDTLRTSALENNVAILAAAAYMRIAELDLKMVKSSRSPRLDFNTAYSYAEQNNDAGLILMNRSNGVSGGLSLYVNLFDGNKTNIRVQNAKLDIQGNKAKYEEAVLRVRMDFENAYAIYQSRLELLRMEQSNLETARTNFARTRDLFNLGQVTTTQYREAQLNLINTGVRINEARFDAKNAEVSLLRISGFLIESANP